RSFLNSRHRAAISDRREWARTDMQPANGLEAIDVFRLSMQSKREVHRRRNDRSDVSSSIALNVSNRLAGPEVDQMNLAAVQTTHHIERIGVVAWHLFNEEAVLT